MSGTKAGTSRASVREALTGGPEVKKGPAATDGVLTPNHDGPEVLEWRAKSGLDVAETSSTYLDDEEDVGVCCVVLSG